MAETQETKKVTIYTFDADKVSHPLISTEKVPEGTQLKANQTLVTPPQNNDYNYWNGSGWANALVVVWEFNPDKNNEFTGVAMIPEGAVLKANQTFVKPKDGLYQPMRFNGTEWIGTPQEEWEKANPVPEQKPSATQIAQATAIKDIAQLKVDHSGQQSLNAQLMKDNAELKVKNETQAKVNADIMKQLANLKIQVTTLSKPAAQ